MFSTLAKKHPPETQIEIASKYLEQAFKTGKLEIVQEIERICPENLNTSLSKWSQMRLFNAAARTGNIDVLDYAIKNGYAVMAYDSDGMLIPFNEMAMTHAITSGNHEMVSFCLTKGATIHPPHLNLALETGNLEIIKLLNKLGFKPYESSLMAAFQSKKGEVVSWLVTNYPSVKKQYEPSTLNKIISLGDPDLLDIAFENEIQAYQPNLFRWNQPYDELCADPIACVEEAMLQVSKGADFSLLTKAFNQLYHPVIEKNIFKLTRSASTSEWRKHLIRKAIHLDNPEILKFIISSLEIGPDYFVQATKSGDFSFDGVISSSNLSIIQILRQAGAPLSSNSLNKAILTGNAEIVEFLIKEGAKPNAETLNIAHRSRNAEIIKLIM
jgi:ankyrin repeat protein